MASNNPNISDLVFSNGYLDVLECATQSVFMLNSHYPLVHIAVIARLIFLFCLVSPRCHPVSPLINFHQVLPQSLCQQFPLISLHSETIQTIQILSLVLMK